MGNFDFKVGNESVPVASFPGLYPIYYLTKDGGILCPKCVNANLGLCADSSDSQWYVIASDANWENPILFCDNCGCRIESAYAESDNS
jgi:hypothetical protein